MGVLAAGIFGTLTAKLWTMQVLSSEAYRSKADDNSTPPSPRPRRAAICDVNGVPLVKSRVSLTVVADAEVASDRDVVQRLSAVLGCRQHGASASRMRRPARKTSASWRATCGDVAFITEHSDAFLRSRSRRYVRDYLARSPRTWWGTRAPSPKGSVENRRRAARWSWATTWSASGIELQYDHAGGRARQARWSPTPTATWCA
ncbi:MAG: hypothetical protein ACLSGS_04230 [Adlercreutzia sp.]